MNSIKLGEKTYEQKKVTARALREFIEMKDTVSMQDMSVGDLDKMVGIVCKLYGCTIDEIYDNLPSSELMPLIENGISIIVGGMNKELDKFPK
jgi:hypothetical protein